MPSSQPDIPVREGHRGWWVVFAVLGLSTLIAVYATLQYARADRFLVESARNFVSQGESLDMEGCVDGVVAWFEHCEIIERVCDKSVDTMMRSCLSARDRVDECRMLGDSLKSTHLDFERCARRGINSKEDPDQRRLSNACASGYRAADLHCDQLLAEAAP
jgi:hypothetical protein